MQGTAVTFSKGPGCLAERADASGLVLRQQAAGKLGDAEPGGGELDGLRPVAAEQEQAEAQVAAARHRRHGFLGHRIVEEEGAEQPPIERAPGGGLAPGRRRGTGPGFDPPRAAQQNARANKGQDALALKLRIQKIDPDYYRRKVQNDSAFTPCESAPTKREMERMKQTPVEADDALMPGSGADAADQ